MKNNNNILFFMIPKSQVECVFEDFSVRQTLEKMEYHRYSSVPLISNDGKYIGTISDGDLLWYIKEKGLSLEDSERVSIMEVKRERHIRPVTISNDLSNLVNAILNSNFVPITDDLGSFIGIVTRRTVINYLVDRNSELELLVKDKEK